MSRAFYRLPKPFGAAAGVAFLAAVIVVVLGGWQIIRTRDALLDDAEQNIRTLSRALAQHAGRTIEAVDLSLVGMVERVEDQRNPAALHTFLHRLAERLAQARNLVVIGADGAWSADSADSHGPLSSLDRAYFQWHRDHPDRGAHIETAIIGRTSGKPGIPLSRRIDGPDGSFAGVAIATLAPDYFETFYKTVRTGTHGTVALWLDDGRMLVRYPALPNGDDRGGPPREGVAAVFAAKSGVARSRSPWDGVERIFAFDHVDNYPLVVSAGVSIDDALSAWVPQAAVEASVIVGAALSLIVLGVGLERHRRRVRVVQRASQEIDRRYRLLAENSSDLVTLKPSFSGTRSYVSPSSRTTVGWAPEELAVLPIASFIHAEEFDRVAMEFASLTPERPRVTSLHRVRHKAGHYIWLESVFQLTEDGNVIVASRDVTARHEAERALAESEARFRLLAYASSDMIQQLDLDGRRRYVSPAATEIFGVEAAALVGTHPVDFIHPDDAARVGAWIGELTLGQRDQARSIHRIRHISGRFVWVEVQFRLVRDRSTGLPLEVVSSVRDVTQREALRHQMEDANRLLHMAEEIAHVGHWRVEVPSNRLVWSDEVHRIHGRDPATFAPTVETAIGLYHPDDRAEVQRCVADAMVARRAFEFALRVVRPDGEVRHVLSRGVCETGSHGEITAVFGTFMDVTDLRQAERAAKDSEGRYRLLADNTTDMITHMDLEGRRLFVSPGSRELLGYDPQELVGTNPQQMIHPDDAVGLKLVFADLASGMVGRAVNVNRLRHKDGRWIWVEASLKLLRGHDGKPSGVVGAIRNIMDRRLADEALRESEARYRLLADHSRDLIALKSTFGGARSYASPSSRSVVGYEPDEFAALPASDYVHPEDHDRVAAEFNALTEASPEITSVHRVRHKAGHWIWLEVDFRLTNAGKSDQTVIVRARDVTARREAEHALAASEIRYRILAETTSDVITQLDMTLKRQYVSPSCRKVFGYEPEEMLGVEPSSKIHPEDADAVRALGARLAAGEIDGDRTVVTYRSLHKRGDWIWIEAAMNLVRDEGTGGPTSLICSLRDVTERQRAARHLERAKLAAEGAVQAKAEFVANMSHELRTPLTGILGVHDLMRDDPSLSTAQRRLLDLAGDAGRSLLAIINDVLDFSKADAGQLVIESVPFDLDDLVASCRELARKGLGDKPVEIVTRCEPDRFGRFMGDPTRVRQILLNLLTNAVKFTARGRIAINAVYREDRATLRVEVSDSGIGIPADRISSLFERFTQADTSITRRYGGTGLGLAICKRLTDLMRGRIGAEAPADGGSIFWFELPLPRHDGPVIGSSRAHPDLVAVSGRKLLLAEDNAANAEIIAAMMASRGHVVSIVSDGAAAVEAACKATDFDLVLMDLQMPVMDGLSAARAIRRQESSMGTRRIPVIGLTANAMVADAEQCLAAGMDAHVAKPIVWPDLFAAIDRLLVTSGRLESADSAPDGPEADLQESMLDELASIIGRDRLVAILTRFAADLPHRMTAIANATSAEVAQQVHMLASLAGQLGFARLSRLCLAIEQEAHQGHSSARIAELQHVAKRAVGAAASCSYARAA